MPAPANQNQDTSKRLKTGDKAGGCGIYYFTNTLGNGLRHASKVGASSGATAAACARRGGSAVGCGDVTHRITRLATRGCSA